MSKVKMIVPVVFVAAILQVAALATANAQKAQTLKTPDVLELGQDHVKALLLLWVDKKNAGQISEQEFIQFMTAEFERLDTNKSGRLSSKDLKDSQGTVVPASRAGK